MKPKSLTRLRQADDRTLHFLPGGFGIGMRFTAAGAARYQQKVVAGITLHPDVGDGTRQSFEMLRTVWAYGVLCYEIFTLVGDHALLVIEQALRERFMRHVQGVLVFVDRGGAEHTIAVASYDDVFEASKTARRHRWQLRAVPGQPPIAFNAMLDGLRRWAREVGLLRGHRNRVIEQALADLRNAVAHPAGPHLGSPVDAARKLDDIAEIINQLWGHPTPGGRLYPAPIRRQPVAIGWTDDPYESRMGLAEYLHPDDEEHTGWQWVIVRASYEPELGWGDSDLFAFDSRHEVTRLPVELLWGPGRRTDAIAWFTANQPQPDVVDPLDRMFIVRHEGPRLWLPMRPQIVAALPATDQFGTWYAIACDDPMSAWRHTSNLVAGTVCNQERPCTGCGVHTVLVGDYAEVAALCPAAAGPLPADVRTPRAHPRWREV